MEQANTAKHAPDGASNNTRASMSKSNDPYGTQLASARKEAFKTHKQMPNRFKVLKKQNIENKRLETEEHTNT